MQKNPAYIIVTRLNDPGSRWNNAKESTL